MTGGKIFALLLCLTTGYASALLAFHQLTHGAMSILWPFFALYAPLCWASYLVFAYFAIQSALAWRESRIGDWAFLVALAVGASFNAVIQLRLFE